MSSYQIFLFDDDLSSGHIEQLLEQHRQQMFKHSPPESVHALDSMALRGSDISFWSAWIEGEFVGCGALKMLSESHGEIKSMKTKTEHLRKGVAKAVLKKIIAEAYERKYTRLSLETGSMDAFIPARKLYREFGFVECEPFADYVPDPNSICMSKSLV